AGSYNTGGFNAGDFNSGSANPGDVNTGSFNTGDTNTGWANTGNLDTGAFISGDQSNGLLWRGDRQGLIAADYTLTIPDIPLTLGGGALIKLPVTGNIAGLTVNPFTIHGVNGGAIPVNFDIVVDAKTDGFDLVIPLPDPFPNIHVPVSGLPISLAIPLRSALDPIQVPQIQFGAIPLNLTVGSDTTLLTIGLTGGSGPIAVPVTSLLPMTGIGNSTTAPSSGFFNSGAGGTSGFGNIGDTISGLFNVGSHISGFENYGGELLSGLTNLGSAMSGFGNTSSLDIAIAGLISGVGNIGNRLSGIFLQGSVP
ncbi:PPE family protein, partial [Mycobacterium paragordonae]